MVILYFIPRYDPALMGNRIHAEVIAAWRAEGVDAEVITLTAGISRPLSEMQEGILVHRLPVSSHHVLKVMNRALALPTGYPYLAGALVHFRRFIAARQYDLVHIETAFPLGFIAALAPRRRCPPLAVTLPGADIMSVPEFDYGYGRFLAVRMILPLVFRQAAVLRADSPQIRSLAVRLGAPPAKVTAIPYNITVDSYPPPGVDLDTLRQQCRADICARYGLDPARPIVVSLNRLHPFKGIEYLVEAIPHARKGGIDPQVVIVGPNRSTKRFGDYGAYLRRRAEELGAATAIMFTGGIPHDQAMAHLAAANAVVVPSVAESFSRVVVEAAAVGTPPIVTRTTGVSDYVAAADCGIVVAPRSGAAIGEALVRLLRDRSLWERCAQRGPVMAAAFNSQTIARQLLRLYEPFLSGKSVPSTHNG
ncbi:MAG: glycosyltransferase family 4 protein [Roseiflexus sp.]|jgi:glycosyltransferase involved in cell wall biosynthesis|nr:glycosyltransferase family 4 protein [Roseiflexus sp.]MBO9383299.1 glycosyltransferase family 4 protein [Roseiflexus sp.]MBO9388079.1 glycosyltransferase family 4 protein [Roseiflexus sp.]